jgi:phosphinothricin acetyltransferase
MVPQPRFHDAGAHRILAATSAVERTSAMTMPIEPVSVRDCHEADMPAVTSIYAHHVLHGTASFETEPPSTEEMCRRRADVLAKGLPYLVADRQGDIVGYSYAGTYRPRAAYRDTVENSVYLRADSAGWGIGRSLLQALLRECEARDLRQVIAVIGDSANIASISLHERCGFRRVGVLYDVGWKHGRWLDSVLMQHSLGRGNGTPPHRRE